MSDDEDDLCPLCVEEMDLSDKFFKPCPCGYRICRFCWHYIKENGNGLCPACRRVYTDEGVQFRPVTAEEMVKLKAENIAKKRAKKEEKISKKHLANTRVVQKNLVYVSGLNPKITTEEALRSNEYFGQFGKILRIVFQKKQQGQALAPLHQSNVNTGGVFVTFASKADAGKAIVGLHGTVINNRMLRANYGTTKYCQTYLRNQACTNAACMYLHEPGEDTDSFSKDELIAARQQLKDQDAHRNRILPKQAPNQSTHRSEAPVARPNVGKPANWETPENQHDTEEGSALPPTASWATKPVTQASRSGPPSAPAPVARKLPEETARPTTAERIDSWEAIEDEAESHGNFERASDITEETVPTAYPDLVKAESHEETSEHPAPSEQTRSLDELDRQLVAPQPFLHTPRPVLSTTEALGIALPFPYASVAEEPSTFDDHFAHDSHYMLPNSRLDRFGMDLNFLKPSLYRGTFDPFGDNQSVSIPPAAPSRSHGLLSPEFRGLGVGLPRQPPYNHAAVQSQTEYHGTFDPFREDIPPVAPTPPGIGLMADNSARPVRPPGLFESGRPAGSHVVTDVIRDVRQTSSDDTQAAGPRRASRFGFAQDPEPRPGSAGAGHPPMRMQTQQQNLASEAAVPADKQDVFKRLFSANNGGESQSKRTVFQEENWSVPSSRLQELSTTAMMPSLNAADGAPRYDANHAPPTLVNAGARDANAEHNSQEFRSVPPNASLPMTSSAQDFLGAFLKAARQHPQPVENKADQNRNGSYVGDAHNVSVDDGSERRKQPAFQDPAIMVIGRRSSSNTTSTAQTSAAPSFPASRDANTLSRYRLPVMQHVTQGVPAEHNVVGSSREARQTPSGAGPAPAKQRQDLSAKGANGLEKTGRKKGDTAGDDAKVAKVNQESKGSSQQHPQKPLQQQKQQQAPQKAQAQPLQIPVSARKNRKGRIAEKEPAPASVTSQLASSRLLSGSAASHDTKAPGGEHAVGARNTAADDKWTSKLTSTAGKGESESQAPSPSDAGGSRNHEQARKVARRGSVSSHGSSTSQPAQQGSGSKKQRNRQQQQAKQNGVDVISPDESLAETSTGNVKESEPAPGYLEKATKPGAGNTSFPAPPNKHQQAATGNRKGGKQTTSKTESASASSATFAVPPSAPSGNAEKDTSAPLPQASSDAVVDNSSGSIQSTVRDIPGVFSARNLPNPVDFLSRDFCLNSAKFGISGDGADVIANALSRFSGTTEAGDAGQTTAGGSPFAGAADDVAILERKVIEARREAALLENQLNAVIKKNRRYTGKI